MVIVKREREGEKLVNRVFVPSYDLSQRRKWAYKMNKYDITRSNNDPCSCVWPADRLIASRKGS